LPGTADALVLSLNCRRASAEFGDEGSHAKDSYERELRAAVRDVVARQRDTGIDLVNDGEYGHAMGIEVQLTTFASDLT